MPKVAQKIEEVESGCSRKACYIYYIFQLLRAELRFLTARQGQGEPFIINSCYVFVLTVFVKLTKLNNFAL